MNEHLVSIKVDREERPDVDAVYMTATQAMTGQGGWPMTVFMTPDRDPFFCGTYFPRDQFQRLVLGVAQAWQKDRGRLPRGQGIAATLAEQMQGAVVSAGRPQHGAADQDQRGGGQHAGSHLRRSAAGGFGGAPKFPPSMVLEFLLRHLSRTRGSRRSWRCGWPRAPCRAMAAGGMYDQLGGGFARYSVDAGWVVPHFEKMLYDNALLARVYAHWWRRTGSELGRRVAAETCAWMIADLQTAEGGFASALDADSEGEEGKYYVWTPRELRDVLGPDDGRWAAGAFGVTDEGTFEHGKSVLQRAPTRPTPGACSG